MLVNGFPIEHQRGTFAVVPFSLRPEYDQWKRVVNLATGEESQAYTDSEARQICEFAVQKKLLGTFGLKEGKPLKVVFRKFRDGDVIALFCHSGADCNPGYVMSYMHVGQHGEADRGIGRNLKLATPDEYRSLLNELRGIYDCAVISVDRLVVN